MKKILIPTDFSTCAENALDYATHLADKIGCEIVLLHVLNFYSLNSDLPYDVFQNTLNENTINIESSFNRCITRINKINKDIKCYSIIETGTPSKVIIDIIKSRKIDFVVMGNKCTHGVMDMIFGNVTTTVIEKAACPVFAIPSEASFRLKKILFATDYLITDIKSIEQIVSEIATAFDSEITAIHVSNERKVLQEAVLEEFKSMVEEKVHYSKLNFHTVSGMDVIETIESYLKTINTDLLVMSIREKSAYERLFNKSLTKEVSYHTQLPLLVFHAPGFEKIF